MMVRRRRRLSLPNSLIIPFRAEEDVRRTVQCMVVVVVGNGCVCPFALFDNGRWYRKSAELKALRIHRFDNIVLLIFTMLLLVVLIVWLFKYNRFVHESSLTLLYGKLISGIVDR